MTRSEGGSVTDRIELHIYGEDVLREEARPWQFHEDDDAERVVNGLSAREMVRLLEDGMIALDGVGLAAPQIGLSVQAFVYDVPDNDDHQGVLFNPAIVDREGEAKCREACLSIPQFSEVVTRPQRIQVEAWDERGNEVTLEAEDFAAVILQHEIDHLRGTMFVDHLSPFKSSRFRKKWKPIDRALGEDRTLEVERP